MFNSYNQNQNFNQNIKFNAVTGNLIKSCRDSYFVRYHLQSEFGEYLLRDIPIYKRKEIVVLQTMIVGDMEVLSEIIYKADYEKLFDKEDVPCQL